MVNKLTYNLLGILIGSVILLSSSKAAAGELRILDSQGLVRAVKEIGDEATVVVRLSQAATTETALLTPVNGLSGDIKGKAVKDGSLEFDRVSVGIWKIVVKTPGVSVRSVELK